MVCAALFDCQWRRARVVDHPHKRMVQVQYVDFGNMGIVPALNLKKLLDKFLFLPTFVSTRNCDRFHKAIFDFSQILKTAD